MWLVSQGWLQLLPLEGHQGNRDLTEFLKQVINSSNHSPTFSIPSPTVQAPLLPSHSLLPLSYRGCCPWLTWGQEAGTLPLLLLLLPSLTPYTAVLCRPSWIRTGVVLGLSLPLSQLGTATAMGWSPFLHLLLVWCPQSILLLDFIEDQGV